MKKTGLVVEGGGMKCAYCAGILDAFMDNKITFDYCIGVSGGSGSAASYVAGQRGRNIRFFTKHLHDPGYFGIRSFLKTGNLFGLQYIYGDLSNSDGKDPFDFPAFMESPMDYQLVATNAATGKPEYFKKEDMKQDDYRCFMASCAIPAACRPVEINGRAYYDGGLTDAVPVKKALEEGCQRLVVILSKPRDYVMKPQSFRFLYKQIFRKYPRIISAIDNRHLMYHNTMEMIAGLEKEGKIFVFAPSRHTRARAFTMNEKVEQGLYELAVRDFRAQEKRLKCFLESP